MNTHKKRTTTTTTKRKKDKIPKVFSQTLTKRNVLYNHIPSMPDEFDVPIRTFLTLSSAATTASALAILFTNSLLHGADSYTATTNPIVTNIGRNYTKYRVVGYTKATIASPNDTVDNHLAIVHSPTDLSAGWPSGASWDQSSVMRDKSFYYLVPSSTKSPCMIKSTQKYDLLSIIGNPEFLTDANYAGTLNASGVPTDPVDLTYAYHYSGKANGTNYTASTIPRYSIMLTQYVKFFDKRV